MSTIKELTTDTASLTADGSASITTDYAVIGAASADVAITDLNAYLISTLGNPPNKGALVLDKISNSEEVQGVYFTKATWSTFARKSKPAEGESQFSFDIGLEPAKVQLAIGGIVSFAGSGEPAWAPQIINDQGEGDGGVDIFEPTYNESETHWVSTASLTPAYRTTVLGIVGRVNNATFKGFAAGEVLFLGVSGGRRGSADSELTYSWVCRPNQSGLSFGSVSGVDKGGWNYLWPRYQEVKGANAPSVKTITHIAVATVFPTADFSGLNIGT